MASLELDIDFSFLEELGNQSQIDSCATAMIDAALPIISERLAPKYAALGKGKLASKLKRTDAKPAKGGGYIGTITLKGGTGHTYGRGYPLSNAGLAVFLEYGTVNNPAYGCIGSAVAEAQTEVEKKMQEVFIEKMGLNK